MTSTLAEPPALPRVNLPITAPVVENGEAPPPPPSGRWNRIRCFYQFLLPLRFSVVALAVAAFAFVVSDQGRDVIAAMAEKKPDPIKIGSIEFGGPLAMAMNRLWGEILFVALVMLLAAEIWYWSRHVLHLDYPGRRPSTSYPRTTLWAPRLLAAATYVIFIIGLLGVATEYRAGTGPVWTLWILTISLLIAGTAFVTFTLVKPGWLHEDVTERKKNLLDFDQHSRRILVATTWLAIIFFLASLFFVQRLARGSMVILLVAMSLWVTFGSIIVAAATMKRIPVITALLVYAILISPLTDNHVVPVIPGTADAVASRPTVGGAFEHWLKGLPATPAGAPVPVFIVATEGGGIRAAYWTATVLTELDDNTPGFRDHLFAISGVSGGSVGTAMYAALVSKQLEERQRKPLRPVAARMLARDSLAPTLAAMMEQDLIQRFVPAPILPDRGRALAGAWERAWRMRNHDVDQTNEDDDRMAQGMLRMMNAPGKRIPSIFLNAATVETGSRVIASNLHVTPAEFADSIDMFDLTANDVPLSAAALNSARFTYVSPAGTIRRGKGGRVEGSTLECPAGARCEHLVDGGYIDNSGATTAIEIANAVRRQAEKIGVPVGVHLIVIQYGPEETKVDSTCFMNEVLSPVRGLMNARTGHATLAVARLRGMAHIDPITIRLVQYRNTPRMPLGWLLSDQSRSAIDAQMGAGTKETGESVEKIASLLRATTP
jgi:patatin-like phospholipase